MNKRIYHKPCVFVSQIETCNMLLALSVEVKQNGNAIEEPEGAWSQERKGPWGGNPWGE